MKFLKTFVFCILSLTTMAQIDNFNLSIIADDSSNVPVEISGGTLLTGSDFTLDAVIQIPANCNKATLSLTIPAYIEIDFPQNQPIQPDAIWACQSTSSCLRPAGVPLDQDYDIIIESLPGAFANSDVSDGVNFQINLKMSMGELCENVPFDFQIDVTYFESDDTACGTSFSEVSTITSAYLDDYWDIELTKLTDDSYICYGGFIQYKIEIPRRTAPGGYDVDDANLMFLTTGRIFDFLDVNYNSIAIQYFYIFAGISSTPDLCDPWAITTIDLNTFGSDQIFYVIEQISCGTCDYEQTYDPASAVLYFNEPCITDTATSVYDSESYDSSLLSSTDNNCCTGYSGPPSLFIKDHQVNDASRVCPGSCLNTSYNVIFNNAPSITAQPAGFCITDELPDHYDVDFLTFDYSYQTYFDPSSSNTASVSFTNTVTGQTVGPFIVNNSNYSNFDLSLVNLDFNQIDVCYDQDIPAFSGFVSFSYAGNFNGDNQVGDIISVVATTNTGLSTIPSTTQIVACNVDLNGYVQSSKEDPTNVGTYLNYSSSLNVNRGEKARVEMRVANNGTSDLNNADLEIEIPTGFTYCLNSVQFYYGGTTNGIIGNTMPDPVVGGTWSETGQLLSLTGFDLPKSCTGGASLFIVIDILTNEDALAGPYNIGYNIIGEYSRSTNITVNSIYKVTANTSVYCTVPSCMTPESDLALVGPGDFVWFKYDIKNEGNVVLSDIDIINNLPFVGNQNSTCSGSNGSTLQGIYYSDEFSSCTINNIATEYATSSCPAVYTSSYSSSATSIKWSSISPDLLPGETYSIIAKYQIDQFASPGQIAYNDFAFTASRNDVPSPTEPQLSNQATLFISPNTCGSISSSDDIDCQYVGLTITPSLIPNEDSCCVTISLQQNLYDTVFTHLEVSLPGGELFTNNVLSSGFQITSNTANQSIIIGTSNGSNFGLGTYEIATLCLDALYAPQQIVNASLITDSIGMDAPTEVCQTSITLNCDSDITSGGDIDYWTKYYGDDDDNYVRRVKSFGNFIYILGRKIVGSNYTPTMSKFDLNGNLVWQRFYDDSEIVFNDFTLSSDQSVIITAGLNITTSTNNRTSVIALINNLNGSLIEEKEYDNDGREQFTTIINHPNPLNSAYPIYILGVELNNGSGDDPMLINLDQNGNINWSKNIVESLTNDDQFFTSLIPLQDGNIIIAGDNIANGTLVKINGQDGSVLNAKESSINLDWLYSSEGFDFGSGIALAGRLRAEQGNNGFVALYDYDLNYIDGVQFPNITGINSLSLAGDGTIFAVGLSSTDSGGASTINDQDSENRNLQNNSISGPGNGPVILRLYIDESGSIPDLIYTDSHELEQGAQDFSSYHFSTNPNYNALFFGSTHLDNVMNDWDIYMGILPGDLNGNCLVETTESILGYTFTMNSIAVQSIDFSLPVPNQYMQYDTLNYTCVDDCEPDCFADFSFVDNSNPMECNATISFTNNSTSTVGPYNWSFGDGGSALGVFEPNHVYVSPGTYYVCLTDLECMDTYCEYITIDFNTEMPELVCSSPIPVCANSQSCLANVSPSVPLLIGGNQDCVTIEYTREDNLAMFAPYPIGTTSVSVVVTNEFGGQSSCLYQVIVEDCTPPGITCPDDIQFYTNDSYAGSIVSWQEPIIDPNCSLVIVSQTHTNGSFFPCGTSVVEYTLSESAGSTSCSFTVTVDCLTCDNVAMDFDGDNDNITLNDVGADNNFTLGAWFLADETSNGGSEDRILSFGPSNRLELGIENNNGNIWFYDQTISTNQGFSTVDVRDGCWHHLAYVADGTTRNLYVDFNLIHSYTVPNINYGPNFRVGAWTGGGPVQTEFGGIIDEVRGYSSAYPIGDLEVLFTTIPANITSDLQIYFDFEDGIPEFDNTNLLTLNNGGQLNDGSLLNFDLLGQESNFICQEVDIDLECLDPCLNDTTPPICTVADDTLSVYLNEDGIATINFSDLNVSYEDECGVALFSVSQTIFDCNDIGLQELGISIYDFSDNVTMCTAYVMVLDTTAPICQFIDEIIVSLGSFGEACIIPQMLEPICTVDPVCISGIAVDYTMQDLDGDGSPDFGGAILTPDIFDGGSSSSCDLNFSLSFSSDITDNTLFLDCSDIGFNMVELWITDENGVQDYCSTTVQLTDSNNECTPDTYMPSDDDLMRVKEIASRRSLMNTEGATDNCNVNDVTLSQECFYCNDVNQTIEVFITVTDDSGNTSMCSTLVTVEDKTSPILICPEDFIITCSDPYDISDLSPFGFPSIFENCSFNIQETIVANLNECGVGVIIRTFDLIEFTTGMNFSCSQTITINDDISSNCCPCVDSLFISNDGITNGTYLAEDFISSIGDIDNGTSITFDAPCILLSNGFEVELGAEFETLNVGCEPCSINADCLKVIDNIDDSGIYMISAIAFNDNSSSSCGLSLQFSFSPDIMDQSLSFDCTDIGFNDIDLWVTDADGNQSSCTTMLQLNDPSDFCGQAIEAVDEKK